MHIEGYLYVPGGLIVTSEEQNANGSLPKLSKDVNVAVVNAVHPLPIPLLNALLPKV